MKLHANARTCPHSRRLAVDRVGRDCWTLAAAAAAAGVSVRTISKWLRRYREEGEQGLLDRCSSPGSVPLQTGEARVAVIAALRRLRMTGAEIAETLGMPASTVSGILTRIGLGKLWRLEPLEPPNRYEKQRPGELVHVDVKKLGRIGRPGHRVTGRVSGGGHHRRAYHLGWEYVHVAIDDATRLVYVEVLEDEKAATAVGFLGRAVAHFAAFGIRVEPARFSVYRWVVRCCRGRGLRSGCVGLPLRSSSCNRFASSSWRAVSRARSAAARRRRWGSVLWS
jgi:transposase